MVKNEIIFRQELERVNEWWLTGRVREKELFPIKRHYFEQVKRELETQRVEIVIGPRRVGKSVLLKQLIASLIEDGIRPQQSSITPWMTPRSIHSLITS